MKFDVVQAAADGRDLIETPLDLWTHLTEEGVRAQGFDRSAAEISGQSGVGADVHAALVGELDGVTHGAVIAGMSTAGDVGG
jgi:hypothetical protein